MSSQNSSGASRSEVVNTSYQSITDPSIASHDRQPRVAIVGTGALACLFGARLQPHAQVTLLGTWQAQLDHLGEHGILLEELDGRSGRYPVAVAADPAAVVAVGAVDWVLVLVKSHATARAAEWARRLLGPSTTSRSGLAITLQNGLGNLELLRAEVGSDRAALGTTVQAAHLRGLGVVRHAGEGPTVLAKEVLAATPATVTSLESFAALLRRAGLPTQLSDDAESLLWEKLVISAAINPLSALLNLPNGFLAEQPLARELVRRVAAEAAQVAAAEGASLSYADAGDRALEVCRSTAANLSSMAQDRRRGAPTEVDAITGAIVKRGRRHGVATPLNELLWSRLGGPAADSLVSASDEAQSLDLLLAQQAEPNKPRK